jgi:hypothetical protein
MGNCQTKSISSSAKEEQDSVSSASCYGRISSYTADMEEVASSVHVLLGIVYVIKITGVGLGGVERLQSNFGGF